MASNALNAETDTDSKKESPTSEHHPEEISTSSLARERNITSLYIEQKHVEFFKVGEVKVTVPEGALAGQKLHFKWNNRYYESTVPFGVMPGKRFKVSLTHEIASGAANVNPNQTLELAGKRRRQAMRKEMARRKVESAATVESFNAFVAKQQRCIIAPDGPYHGCWAVTQFLCTLIVMFAVPFYQNFLATLYFDIIDVVKVFDEEKGEFDSDSMQYESLFEMINIMRVFQVVVNIANFLILADFAMKWRTAYWDDQANRYVYRSKEICNRYARGMALADLISAFPVILIDGLLAPTLVPTYVLDLFWYIYTAKYMVPAVFRFGSGLDDCAKYLNLRYELKQLINLVVILLVTIHWMACWWNAAGNYSTLDGESWAVSDMGGQGRYAGVDAVAAFYISAMYFAAMTATSIGYGDISASPGSDSEKMEVSMYMLVVAFSYAFIVAGLADIVAYLNEETATFHLKMDALNRLMVATRAPKHLHKEFQVYLENDGIVQKEKLYMKRLEQLPEELRARFCGSIAESQLVKAKWIRDVHAFKPEFVGYCAMKMRPKAYSYLDDIISIGEDTGRSGMHVIQRGLAGGMGRVLRAGSIIGEDIVCKSVRRWYSATAITYVNTLCLTSKDLHELLNEVRFAAVRKVARRYAIWLCLKGFFYVLAHKVKQLKTFARKLEIKLSYEMPNLRVKIQVLLDSNTVFVKKPGTNHSELFDIQAAMRQLRHMSDKLLLEYTQGKIIADKERPLLFLFKPRATAAQAASLGKDEKSLYQTIYDKLQHLESKHHSLGTALGHHG